MRAFGDYENIIKLKRNRQLDEALELAVDLINDDPSDTYSMYLAGVLLRESERLGLARPILEYVSRIDSQRAEPLIELAQTYKWKGEYDKAVSCFRKAAKLDKNIPQLWTAWGMLEAYGRANPDQAEKYLRKALALAPNYGPALDALSVCHLLRGNYAEGFQWSDQLVGYCPNRKIRTLQDSNTTPWDGSPGKFVVIYAEQGIGDEILFASCLEDAANVCEKVYLECSPKLDRLFRRSFASIAKVYGTILQDTPHWYTEAVSKEVDHTCSIGVLPKFFRKDKESFRKASYGYLFADPDGIKDWRRRWMKDDSIYHIGIAWTGGMISRPWERQQRNIPLPIFMEALDKPRRKFVSLEYNDDGGSIDGYPVSEYREVTQGTDYDDTASLVASLDLVVSVPTSVVHLAGALGVPCICVLPEFPSWRFGLQGQDMVWHDSVTLVRQQHGEPWESVMIRVEEAVDAHLRKLRASA